MQTYIHERSGWPTFPYDAVALLAGLERVGTKRGRLFGVLEALGFEGMQERDLAALTEELIKSNAIEGDRLDPEAVRSSVARRLGIDRGGVPEKSSYVDGLVEMAMDVAQRYQEPLTAERIFNWHAALFPTGRNVFGPIKVGTWRDDAAGPMVVASKVPGQEVVHFQAPAAERLPAETARFLAWIEAENEPSLIVKAGIAHLWFETLHPLDDGNGRVGRNIIDLLLARADQIPHRPYSLSPQIYRKRNEYYDLLEASQKGSGDCTEWLVWFLDRLADAVDEAIEQATQAISRTRFWNAHQGVPLNDRQRKVISRLLMGWEGKMTNNKYAKLTDCSDASAARDLAELVSRGILSRSGGGRSTAYEIIVDA